MLGAFSSAAFSIAAFSAAAFAFDAVTPTVYDPPVYYSVTHDIAHAHMRQLQEEDEAVLALIQLFVTEA